MLGAVTASSQAAADTGAAALCAGGNAVDAIVTAALASCVADPCNTGTRRLRRILACSAGEPAGALRAVPSLSAFFHVG